MIYGWLVDILNAVWMSSGNLTCCRGGRWTPNILWGLTVDMYESLWVDSGHMKLCMEKDGHLVL